MDNGRITYTLGDTLEEIGITRNKIAVEAKVRPATILDLVSGETKTIKLETLVNILGAVNNIAREKGIKRTIGIEDIIKYNPHV